MINYCCILQAGVGLYIRILKISFGHWLYPNKVSIKNRLLYRDCAYYLNKATDQIYDTMPNVLTGIYNLRTIFSSGTHWWNLENTARRYSILINESYGQWTVFLKWCCKNVFTCKRGWIVLQQWMEAITEGRAISD